ncbi:MAG: tRNA (adenosine(37)-N6)-threonylcarbamoyltransferase complex transferase subunit TsaD [Planctomycetaceae bacterium]
MTDSSSTSDSNKRSGTRVPLLLAIESSCDETAAAVIDRDLGVRSSVVASQDELHRQFGGVVPEIASRAHVRRIIPTIDEALQRAGVSFAELSAVAVVTEPGLVGSLLVGLTAAKSLALSLGLPLIAVNHIEAHIYACRMAAGREIYPTVGFVVSGGHTNLYDCTSPVECRLIGSTIDDAAGEAFDKAAKLLGLPYPGGPSIERTARRGDRTSIEFPRPMIHSDRLEFSFSGLKTALLYEAFGVPGSRSGEAVPPLDENRIANLAASFQEAVVDVLVAKCRLALKQTGRKRLAIGGGVAANGRLKERLEELAERMRIELVVAPIQWCTDNAAMAAVAWEKLARGETAELDIDVTPGLVRKR